MPRYDPHAIERKWQQYWEREKTFRAVEKPGVPKRYVLNTAISRLMEFVNAFTGESRRPRACIEPFVLMLAPLAPHMAEELWEALGHAGTLAHAPWPSYDEALTRDATSEIPVPIDGKVRSRITLPADADRAAIESAALADARVKELLAGHPPKKLVVVPGRLVSIVR